MGLCNYWDHSHWRQKLARTLGDGPVGRGGVCVVCMCEREKGTFSKQMPLKCTQHAERGSKDKNLSVLAPSASRRGWHLSWRLKIRLHILEKDFHQELCAKAKEAPTQWTWVWVDSGSWWWTGRPGMLQFMGLQRVRHDWATELNLSEILAFNFLLL